MTDWDIDSVRYRFPALRRPGPDDAPVIADELILTRYRTNLWVGKSPCKIPQGILRYTRRHI